ncbi:MAG TPA: lasso peptide biosynthesis protein [Oculatellaceae cyanobacterium]
MRIVTDVGGLSFDEILPTLSSEKRDFVQTIIERRKTRTRPKPSKKLLDRSALLSTQKRARLIDQVALLVDENMYGRSNLCFQFAELIQRALTHSGLPAKAVVGMARYLDRHETILFEWRHAWVECGDEVIDGNVDILSENPFVPRTVSVRPYWGSISELPKDRTLEPLPLSLPYDNDVETKWWPDLKTWWQTELLRS